MARGLTKHRVNFTSTVPTLNKIVGILRHVSEDLRHVSEDVKDSIGQNITGFNVYCVIVIVEE